MLLQLSSLLPLDLLERTLTFIQDKHLLYHNYLPCQVATVDDLHTGKNPTLLRLQRQTLKS